MAELALGEDAEGALFAPALRAGAEEPRTLAAFLAAAHNAGVEVDWKAFFAGSGAQRVDLPTYAFQRQRYWLAPHRTAPDLAQAGLSAVEHPLLQGALSLPSGAAALTGKVSLAHQPWLRDHAVFGRAIFPATALAELLLAAARQTGSAMVEEMTIEAPLVLTEDDELSLQVVVGEAEGDGRREVEVYSRGPADARTNGDGPQWIRHASGVLAQEASRVSAALRDLAGETWPPAGAEPLDIDPLYDRLADAGFGYGPAFQGLVSAWQRGAEIFCEVAVAAGLMADGAGFGVHPALLDAAFHATVDGLSAASEGDSVPLPFALSGVRLHQTGAPLLRVRLEVADDGGAVSLEAVDANAEPVLEIESMVVRPIDAKRLGAAAHLGGDALLRPQWVALALDEDAQPPARCAVLGDGLEPLGDGPAYDDLEALVAAIKKGEEAPEIVLASPLATTASAGTNRLLSFLQAWLAAEECDESRLVLLTRGATVLSDGEAPDPNQAALWGLVRSAQFEHPERFLLVDLDEAADTSAIPWPALVAADEQQLAVRRGGVYALRLSRQEASPALVPPPGEDRWHLDAPRRGTLEDLALVESERAKKPLDPGEVRVAVHAAGVNFRDVLIALGHYKDDDPIGGEGAGVVLEVGEAVTDLAPGDRILGPIIGAFGPVAVTDRRLVAKLPASWSYTQAASVPIAFTTAYHGLFDLGGLSEGQAVLVHAGAGAVGMAAIQLARRAGAEVYATASPGKWDALRSLGLADDHIASSRDLGFRERFLAATEGRGVDLVLNSLAHDFVDASLDLLPRGGRFIEMGKSDIRDAEEVGRDHAGVHYRAFDLVPSAGPDRVGEILAEVVASVEAGTLHPIPVRAWDIRRAPEAFRHLGDGRNVGKVVLTVPRSLDPEGTVLITGGTGDLGARVARHLAREHGVRRLLLTSRRGMDAPGAAELVEELRELGAEPSVAACDAADRDDVAALLAAVDPEHPLTAVVHTAGVLDDGVIESLTAEQVERVLRPKADAALLLDELTRESGLAEFILFSSQSGLMGAPGQGNYAAANGFLDALAERRRAQGLPAKSLAWGLWSDATGMGKLDESEVARLARVGAAPMRNELELFDAARASAETVVVPTRLDAAALRAAAEAGILPPLLRDLVRGRAGRERKAARSLGDRLAGVPEDEREDVILDAVSEQVAAVLGYSSGEEIDPERDFKELGFDSLGAVELRNRLGRATGKRLPSTLVFDHPSPLALTHFLLTKLVSPGNGDGAPGPEQTEPIPAGQLSPVDDLDADELVRLAKETT
jgi:NADPH:quinone reductase-like Zn-dependent oxidoreductase/acyl carrier protein